MEFDMKYCSKCGRELFDKDIKCDKCKSTDFISEKECKEIIQKINNANMISKKKLFKDPIYKMVYDSIINKPKYYINYNIKNNTNESNEEYFNRINRHTINNSQNRNIPKCPTCGSTNIKKISGTKRWLSAGLFGLASSNIGKSMYCQNCGYKW